MIDLTGFYFRCYSISRVKGKITQAQAWQELEEGQQSLVQTFPGLYQICEDRNHTFFTCHGKMGKMGGLFQIVNSRSLWGSDSHYA